MGAQDGCRRLTFVDALSRSFSHTPTGHQLKNRPAAALAASSGQVDDPLTRFSGSFFAYRGGHRPAERISSTKAW